MIYLDVANKIEKLRDKMHKSISRNGINSNETQEISRELDKIINEYYAHKKTYSNASVFEYEYEIALNKLKEITEIFGDFPNIKEWNKYAKENILLSSQSLEYISGLNWNHLRQLIISKNR